jgi:hypothetical protein
MFLIVDTQHIFNTESVVVFYDLSSYQISHDSSFPLVVTVESKVYVVAYSWSAGHSGRAVWGVGLGRLVAGIVGSNPAQGMDVCP